MTGDVRDAFAERFGEHNAAAVEDAAEMHKNGVHDDPGSDPFKWALCIAIGHECMGRFASDHGFTATEGEVRDWVYENADLGSHDGDIDVLAALAGAYDGWLSADAYRSGP